MQIIINQDQKEKMEKDESFTSFGVVIQESAESEYKIECNDITARRLNVKYDLGLKFRARL